MLRTRPRDRAAAPPGPAVLPSATPSRVLMLGGTSEIGLAILAALNLPAEAEVLLAGRDEARLAAAAKELRCRVTSLSYDATDLDAHQAVVDSAFGAGPVDLVISAAGVLIDQDELDTNPRLAGPLVETNFTRHVTS